MNAQQHSRFGSFFNRVQTEREVLDLINLRFGPQMQISGLTEAAITRWSSQMFASAGLPHTEARCIVELVRRISARADAYADQSRVVFDDDSSSVLPIDELVAELRSRCQPFM